MFRLLSPLTAERSKFLGKGVRGNDPFFKKGLPPISSVSDLLERCARPLPSAVRDPSRAQSSISGKIRELIKGYEKLVVVCAVKCVGAAVAVVYAAVLVDDVVAFPEREP